MYIRIYIRLSLYRRVSTNRYVEYCRVITYYIHNLILNYCFVSSRCEMLSTFLKRSTIYIDKEMYQDRKDFPLDLILLYAIITI